MSQLVGHEAFEADRTSRQIEVAPPEVSDPEHTTPGRGEHELVGTLPGKLLGERIAEEAGDRHRPRLVGLRRLEDRSAMDLDHRLGDVEPAAKEINPPDPKAGRLAPSKSAVGKHQDKGPVPAAAGSQRR